MKFLQNNAKNHFTDSGLEVSKGVLLIFIFPHFFCTYLALSSFLQKNYP